MYFSNVNLCMFSYFEPNFIEFFFFFFKKVVFKFWPKLKWREIKIGYLAPILKQYNILRFFSEIMVFDSVYIYGANFIAKFRWFSKGVPWNPPWALTGVKVPWSLKCCNVIRIDTNKLKTTTTTTTLERYRREFDNIALDNTPTNKVKYYL